MEPKFHYQMTHLDPALAVLSTGGMMSLSSMHMTVEYVAGYTSQRKLYPGPRVKVHLSWLLTLYLRTMAGYAPLMERSQLVFSSVQERTVMDGSHMRILAHDIMAMDILSRHFPNEQHVFIFDNAPTHLKHAADALISKENVTASYKTWQSIFQCQVDNY